MRGYILGAIFRRDLKETIRNPQTLIIVGMTIALNVFLSLTISKSLWVMTYSMSLVMVGFTLTSFIVTEEKDKKTLEALLVSPANYSEVLFGKLFLAFTLTVLISFGLIFSLHINEISITHTLVAIPLGALVICLFGMVIGLICSTQAALSGIGTILMLGLFLPELLAPTNDYIGYLARALPTHHVIQVSSLGKEGISVQIFKHYGMLVLSLIVTIMWVMSFVKTLPRQESRSWKYSKSNKFFSGLLLLVLAFSSFVFLPYRGKIIQENNEYKYFNAEYSISVPIETKMFKHKEYNFQNKFVVNFILRSAHDEYLYLTMKKNKKNLTQEKDLENMVEDLKKENVLNLKVEKIMSTKNIQMHRLEYESKNGSEAFYMFSTHKFLYRFGVNAAEKSENSELLKNYLDRYSKSLDLH